MSASLERGALLRKRYRIIDILGRGGMGSVYRAVDENLGVDVAVKENLFTTDEYARQFRLEAVILANLRHANLPRVTDHFVISEQGQYLIMDYIEGEDLRQHMERTSNIAEEEAILIGVAICDALQYLHTRKPAIVHRDIKPGNVRITPDGHIFLVDFGLAKLVKGSQATTTGARAMTPGYSPPEQYGTARTDSRTDVYSLGATLYAALTGVVPEDGLARAMDNVELTPLRKRNPIVSRKLANAIEKAMAVRPDDRFQSAEEFKQILLTTNVKTEGPEGEIIVEPPPQASIPGVDDKNLPNKVPEATGNDPALRPASDLSKTTHSTSWWIFFSFFLLTIILALLAIIIFWSPITRAFLVLLPTSTPDPSTPTIKVVYTLPAPPPQGITPTIQISLTLTGTPSLTPEFIPTVTPEPTLILSGTGKNQIAFASDRTGAPQIYLMNMDGSNPQQVTNMPDGACQPDWSPDGMRITFISPCLKRQDQYTDVNIYIINADGSDLTELISDKNGNFDPAWSPDGTRLAFTSVRDGSRQIYLLNLDDNSITALTSFSSDVHLPDWSCQPAWSLSGTQILYTAHSRLTEAMQIWVMSDSGRGQTLLIRRGGVYWNFLPNWSSNGNNILFSETKGDQALGWLMRYDYEHPTVDAVHLRVGTFGTHGDYSPDGNWVVYESKDIQNTVRPDYDIYLVRADGTGAVTRLTNDKTMEFDPAWRP